MLYRNSIGAAVLAAVFVAAIADVRAQVEMKYPDWSGQWLRTGGIQWDPTKPLGRGQQAPLTPEYQAIFEASLADQAVGGAGNDARYSCFPVGIHPFAQDHIRLVREQYAAPNLHRRA